MGRRTLLVVESPAKARTIQKIVGADYIVLSSAGHLKDLPENRLGVNIKEGFKPTYTIIKGKERILEHLRNAAKTVADVLLAPDPDREGEAIAYHIATELEGMGVSVKRVNFFEITPPAVQRAILQPQDIDMNKVWAQQARRVLDRLVGYKLSPLLWKKVKGGLSAGRVQSVAVLLVCKREEQIREFVPRLFWQVEAILERGQESIRARLYKVGEKILGKLEKAEAERVAEKLRTYSLAKVEKKMEKEQRMKPPPPFITSTLQQEAARRLSFSVERTMKVAQQLYEGLKIADKYTGLITYMRTDSPRISEQFKRKARSYIEKEYGTEYLPKYPPVYKAPAGAQQAHEAIRPTSLHLSPDAVKPYINEEQLKLYKLVWQRFLASQMCAKRLLLTLYWMKAGECTLVVKGKELLHKGFSIIWEEEEHLPCIPRLKEGEELSIKGVECKECKTLPPPRYSEATLVRALEKKGVGRPSTYAPIISTIYKRGYIRKERGKLYPTELGEAVTKLLQNSFPNLLNIEFTAQLEEELDKVEEGKKGWRQLLEQFWSFFEDELKEAHSKMPDLRHTLSGRSCRVCGAPLYEKYGRFGKFLLCSRWPECKGTEPLSTQIKCRRCSGMLTLRYTKRGRPFYVCSNAPECSFILWDEPVGECKRCGSLLIRRGAETFCTGCQNAQREG